MTILESATWTLAELMRKARKDAGLEQGDIARLIGVSRTAVSGWETGRTEPSASNFVRWAQATGQSLDFLAEGVKKAPASVDAEALSVHPPGLEPGTH